MGKLFLYAAVESEIFSNTRAILENRQDYVTIGTLSCGDFFGSETSQELRSGNILILEQTITPHTKQRYILSPDIST